MALPPNLIQFAESAGLPAPILPTVRTRFSSTTPQTLRDDLRTVLGPECTARAREVAARMTTPAHSVAVTADLLEGAAANHTAR